MGGPPPTTWIVDAVQRADGIHDRFLGAFDMTGRLVGIAQFDRGGDERAAEIAVVVDHDWQRQGVGTFLLRRLAGDARRQGITEFTATFFADNMGIRRLLRDVGPVTAGTVSCGEGSARLDLLRVG